MKQQSQIGQIAKRNAHKDTSFNRKENIEGYVKEYKETSFIYEFLNNADEAYMQCPNSDNKKYPVNFQLKGDFLIFSHQGKGFDSKDIDTICRNIPVPF
jgi:hypothetical protein